MARLASVDARSARMLKGGSGQIASFAILIFLPLSGSLFLSKENFAIWAVLSSVATAATALDFGGYSLVMGYIERVADRSGLIMRGCLASASGSVFIGAIAEVVWLPYSRTPAASAWSFWGGASAIGVITVACVLRSIAIIFAGVMLADHQISARNTLMVGQAVVAVTVAVAVSAGTDSAWALPVAWLVGTAASTVFGLVILRRTKSFEPRTDVSKLKIADSRSSQRQFAAVRTVATIISAVMLQGDRWVIGAAGGAVFLSGYEVMWRIGTIPRSLVQAFSASLMPDASGLRGRIEARDVYRRATHLSVKVTLVSSSACLPLAVVGAFVYRSPNQIISAVAILVAFAVNGLAAVPTAMGIGAGRGSIDLPFLTGWAVITGTAWFVGLLAGNVWIVVIGGLTGNALVYLLYFVVGEKRALAAWTQTTNTRTNS